MVYKPHDYKPLLAKAHAPYSHVQVAAILKTNKGEFHGVNIENAVYPSGICAERTAIFNAITQHGIKQHFQELHIYSSLPGKLYPCGGCLQVMAEFFVSDTTIFIYDMTTGVADQKKLGDLLPNGISKEDFGWK